MIANFALTRLVIRKDDRWNRNVLRILKQGEQYQFNGYGDECGSLERDFFAAGVTISAIVGKNGSGKSSLLDLTYRMFNNLGYCLKRSLKHKPTEPHLGFVPDLYADLDFVVTDPKTDVKTYCCIHNYGDTVAFEYGKEKFKFPPIRGKADNEDEFAGYEPLESLTRKELGKLSHCLFYTIVINYSMQAFLPDEYTSDGTLWLQDNEPILAMKSTWIDEMFHKNDGYMTPIVLNPYRNHGTIDMGNIDELIDTYALSLLIFYKNRKRQKEFMPGYTTGRIEFSRNDGKLIDKCRQFTGAADRQQFMNLFCDAVKDPMHYASQIVRAYGFDTDRANGMTAELYLYLVYKIFAIAAKYADYEVYSEIGRVRNCVKPIGDADFEKVCSSIRDLVKLILSDPSHITFKIRQTCYLLCCLELVNRNSHLGKMLQCERFTIDDYVLLTSVIWKQVSQERQSVMMNGKAQYLERIIQTLPPPLFNANIVLKNKNGVEVDFHHLSSGERQFMHTLCTMVYHINNIRTIKSTTRLRYRKINIVLDEAELCFHPEMQRRFVDALIKYLSVTGLTWYCAFHILIVTHSPFILSDIPQCNILYLEEGRQINGENAITVNPFGANVNDVLAQSFFLDRGFVGEFAKKKIEGIVSYLKSDKLVKDGWNMDKAERFIHRIIGEPIIRKMLEDMLHEKNIRR